MTLQPKDLMIGDLLTFEDCVKDGKIIPIEVVELHGYNNDFLASIDGDEACDMLEFDDEIVGIPLTPEILKKNGFIKDDGKDDKLSDVYHLLVPTGFEGNSFTIQVSLYREPICGVSTLIKCWGWLPPHNGGMNDIHLCSANYVHELQHALKLCGIEKTIEL